ncbi:MAG: hypothetical protein HYW23_04070 [Candidatus Aenigmarchaeota archaeon]|nr:hypothetical protein [Candidatus Aenigmarchaeota archaeon]
MKRDFVIGFGIVILSFLILVSVFSAIRPAQVSQSNNSLQQRNILINSATINLPAVDNQGNGVIAKLKVQAIPGEGRLLTNIDNIFFWVDTQYSIRTAERVAQNITGADLSKIDLIYTIETDASLIEGGSAGAALTVATVAVLENKTLSHDVMITGTINPDGTVGPIGAVFAKAKAAKDVGTKLFLVPVGQGSQVNYVPEKKCEQIGPVTLCTTEYKPQKLDISKDIGIEVKEVSNVQDALNYFLGPSK